MVWLTLTIGLSNIGLGFALAMYFGFGPPDLVAAWRAFWNPYWYSVPPGYLPFAQSPRQGSAIGVPAATTSVAAMSAVAVASLAASAPVAAALGPEIAPPETDSTEAVAAPDCASVAPSGGEAAAAGSAETPAWNLDEKYVENALLKLSVAILRTAAATTEIDTRLRASQGNCDAPTARQGAEQLRQACETYLLEQCQVGEEFHQRLGELGELGSVGEQIEMANFELAAQLETTLSNLAHMDLDKDPKQAADRMLAEIAKLRASLHKLRDDHERAFLAIARQEGRLPQIEESLKVDGLTKLSNRIGVETTLQQWCDENWRQQELVLSLLDLDGFKAVNEEHGGLAGDRVIYHMAQYLLGAAGEGNLVCRFAGQQFLIVNVNLGPRTVTKQVELIRQSIERMTFTRGGKNFHLTASVAVTPVKPDDTPDRLFSRLQEAMSQAKQSGRNRTCLQDGPDTQWIQSPNLGAEYRDILI